MVISQSRNQKEAGSNQSLHSVPLWGSYSSLRLMIRETTDQEGYCYPLHAGFFLGSFFYPEDGGDMFIRNVGGLLTDYTELYSRR
jgi:hypothetical protein